MATIAELNIDITGRTTGLESAMNQAAGIVESAGDRMTSAGAGISAGISAPLGLIGGLAINAATDLNENLGNVQSLGVAQEQVEEYKESIQDLAVAVAKDTSDLSDGLYQVVSAFGDGADTVEILETNAKAAAAGLATTTDAINLTSAVTKGYGDTSAQAVQDVADLAFKTVQLGQTTFPELASSMGRVVPLGASMGASMQELFGVMATGTGVTGSAAEVSTQLRGILQSMAAPTSQMSSLIEEWGFQSGEAALESMGLQGVIGGIVKEAQDSGLPLQKYISSIEGQTLALALAGPQADVFTEKLNAMESASGAMDEAFQAQTEGINSSGFAMAQARQKLSVFLQDVGDGLAPLLSLAIDYLTPLVDLVSSWAERFSELSPRLQLIIGGIGAFLVVLGPALLIAGQMVGALTALGPAFAVVGAAIGLILSPLGLLVAGLAALLVLDVGGIRTRLVEFGNAVVESFGTLIEYVGSVAGELDTLKDVARDLWDAFEWLVTGQGFDIDWWYDITNGISKALGIPMETTDKWAESLFALGERSTEVFNAIVLGFTTLQGYIEEPLARLRDSFDGLSTIDIQPVIDAFYTLGEAIQGIFVNEGDGTGARFAAALGVASLEITINAMVSAVEQGIALIQALIETVANVLTLFATTVEGVSDLVTAIIHNDMEGAIEAGKTIVEGFVTFLENQLTIISNLAGKIAESIYEFVGFTFEDIGILLEEPEWLMTLIDWYPDKPQWVTDLIAFEWERPDWVKSLLDFKLPLPDWLGRFEGLINRIPGVNADNNQLGSRYYPGGWSWVGEAGPELMYVPRGSAILPNRQSVDFAGQGAGVTVVINELSVRDQRDVWAIAEELDSVIRRRG